MDKTTNPTIEKELHFADSVLEKIAGQTAHQVDGVLELSGGMMSHLTDRFRHNNDPAQGVAVEIDDREVMIELDAVLEYGKPAPQIFDQIINQMTKSILEMTGLTVTKITLNVEDLLTKKEWLAENEVKPKNDPKKEKNKRD